MDLRPLSSSPQFQVSSFWRIYLMRLTQTCKRCLTISETPTRPTSAFHTFRSLTFGLHLKFRCIVAKIFNKCFNRFWQSTMWVLLRQTWLACLVETGPGLVTEWAGLDGECWILFPLLDDCDSCDNVERYTVLHSVTQTTVILIRHHQPVFYLSYSTALSWTSLAANGPRCYIMATASKHFQYQELQHIIHNT